ncbi:MAG: AtpZ/AtpI family protein [Candidatus Halalkalibacterium sp. M3_1C_030]
MNAENNNEEEELEEAVRIKSERKIRFRNKNRKGLLYGLGMFGLVGWSVAIPTLIMLALGIWIDRNYQSPYSWTLMLLVLGISIGCLNAWYWVSRESKSDGD